MNLKSEEIDNIRELQQIYNGSDEASKVLHDAEKLEGSVRNTGVHACGIIIAPQDIDELVPVARSKDSPWMQVQYDVTQIEDAGLLKMDFLGLSTLTILKDAISIIKDTTGDIIDIEEIPLEDTKTYELFQRGETNGIFQFESPGMQKYMRDLKPTKFGDLIAMNALYRPGPMKYIPEFVDRKHDRKPVVYDLPEMEEYLKETYGITVYQEQVMLLSQKLAGFSKGKADVLRKAMGKKKRDIIDQLKGEFMEGALAKGFHEDVLHKIYSDWEEFAQYAFNKSHSTCYAVIAFQTAYLKAHYPAQFMAAVLKSNMGDIKKITFYMEECHRMEIKVLGPDLNESKSAFTVTPAGEIRFGMNAVKGVGENAVLEVLREREENGPFSSIFDLTTRVNLRAVNKKNLENMAKSGVFDFDERYHRSQYLEPDTQGRNGIEKAVSYGQQVQSDKLSGQMNIFGGEDATVPEEPKLPMVEPYSLLEELKIEEELVGVYLSRHPLDNQKFLYELMRPTRIIEVQKAKDNIERLDFKILGIVTADREFMGQNGNPYGKITLMDYSGSSEFWFFRNDFIKHKSFLSKDYVLIIHGSIEPDREGTRARTIYKKIMLATELVPEKVVRSVSVTMRPEELFNGKQQALLNVMTEYPGDSYLMFNFQDPDEDMGVTLVSENRITYSQEVKQILTEMSVEHHADLKIS